MSCGVIITGKPDAGKMYQLGRDFALAVFADLARKENFDCEDILHGLLTGGSPLRKIHFTKREAAAEAEELTATTGNPSYILQTVSVVRVAAEGSLLWEGKEEEIEE